MKSMKSGKRQPLLLYRRTFDRIFWATLIFGSLLLVVWSFPIFGGIDIVSDEVKTVLFLSAVVVLTLSIFAFLARFRAYAQAHHTHLCVVTPLLRLNISYKRIRSAHPALMQQLFPMNESSWTQRSFLSPFYGKTAVVVELKGYPLNPFILRLFLPTQMFSPQTTGFVLLVPDWMNFSTELDTLHGKWLGIQNGRGKLPGSVK